MLYNKSKRKQLKSLTKNKKNQKITIRVFTVYLLDKLGHKDPFCAAKIPSLQSSVSRCLLQQYFILLLHSICKLLGTKLRLYEDPSQEFFDLFLPKLQQSLRTVDLEARNVLK